jgi:preprotein translocase subunit YajC
MPADFRDGAIMDFLSFFISDAAAQAAPATSTGSGIGSLLLIPLMLVVFYFMLIRPQQKKEKERRAMIDALSVGSEVVTGGGVLGKVTTLGEQFVTLEIADGVEIKVQRHSIGAVLPKDTIKHA